ncbi:MAG: hypothetical protein VYA06_00425 [Chloroflexota bacterium]|nr:hypothetical protein [Chloroflexota bacterium]
MKYLLIAFLITLISCSYTNQPKETTKVFTLDEVKSSGFKNRGEFQTEFKDSEISIWGFYKGREVAFIMYPSVELAKSSGLSTAKEQTEKIEIVEKNIGHGPNVEKLACRGYKPGVGVAGRGGLKLNSYSQSVLGLNGTLIINKSDIFLTNDEIENNAPPCVRREPLYTHYKIFGNLVIMAEPLTTEDENDTADFVEKISSALPE